LYKLDQRLFQRWSHKASPLPFYGRRLAVGEVRKLIPTARG
jgi:hypothetical protein